MQSTDTATQSDTNPTDQNQNAKSSTSSSGGASAALATLPQTPKQWGQTLLLVVLTLLTTSLAVTISLLWNSAIQEALDSSKWAREKSKLITAGIFTVIGILLTMLFVAIAAWGGVNIPGTSLSASAQNIAA